jgi:cell fate (sporulation/competence/biofilm development) regulator YmcA (YheA/YmcA/DUF963 family)
LNTIEEKAKTLNQYLLQNNIIKEYQKYEALIKENKELKEQEIRMKELQQCIVKQKASQDENVVLTIKEYENIKKEFENHPLVVNYLYLKEEVDMLLQHINARINGELSNYILTK